MRVLSERSQMSDWLKGRASLAGVVVVAAVLAAGCGGSSSSSAASHQPTPTGASAPVAPKGSTSKVLLASVQTTAAAKSARVSMTVSSSGLAAFSLTGDGVVDFANGDSQLTVHFGGAAASLVPDGLEERSVDHVEYVEMPGLGGSDHWISIDASKLGISSSSVPGLGESDPRQFLASLETVSDNVTKVGSEVIRGVETTHYHATLDLGKSLDQADVPPSLRDAEKQFLGANGTTPTLPVDVFIDGDGYVRRISLGLDLGDLGGLGGLAGGGSGSVGSALSMTVSLDFFDFGTPVNVQAPPPDQVSQEPLFGGLGDLGGSGATLPGAVSSAV